MLMVSLNYSLVQIKIGLNTLIMIAIVAHAVIETRPLLDHPIVWKFTCV